MCIHIRFTCTHIYTMCVRIHDTRMHTQDIPKNIYGRGYIHPIPLGVTFLNAISKLKAQSSKVSFATIQWKEPFEL